MNLWDLVIIAYLFGAVRIYPHVYRALLADEDLFLPSDRLERALCAFVSLIFAVLWPVALVVWQMSKSRPDKKEADR